MVAGLQPGEDPPVARTYRNAYGTHLECSSTCLLMLGVHVVLVVGGFLLLSVIPVRSATNEKREAPFVLWFGSPQESSKLKQLEGGEEEGHVVQNESLWRRAASWLGRRTSSFFSAAPGRDVDMRYRFHADMTQQLAASVVAAKTYESIAVSTDDLEDKPPPRLTSRSSIFVAPQSPRSPTRSRQASTRFARGASSAAIGGRTLRTSSGGVETKEDFDRAISRQQSMAARTERRATLAQEDVSYENLGDDEIRMYEYLSFVRELLEGLAIKKVCQKSGRVVSRTLYITPDMTTVFWNPAGTFKRLTTKSSIQTQGIEQVLNGIHGSANATARSTPERDALCVSIRTSDDKWLVLEAKAGPTRQRLFLGFLRLAQEQLEPKPAAAKAEATIPEGRETEDTEGEGKLERLSEEEVELTAEQPDYEEIPRPPLPDKTMLIQSYQEETSEGDRQQYDYGGDDEGDLQDAPIVENQSVEDDGVEEYRSLERQEENELKSTGEEDTTEEFLLEEPGEENTEDVVPGEVSSNPDRDPERSLE